MKRATQYPPTNDKLLDSIRAVWPFYSPLNCRWATPQEQQDNSRITEARRNGTKKALKALSLNPELRTKNSIRCSVTGKFLPNDSNKN